MFVSGRQSLKRESYKFSSDFYDIVRDIYEDFLCKCTLVVVEKKEDGEGLLVLLLYPSLIDTFFPDRTFA